MMGFDGLLGWALSGSLGGIADRAPPAPSSPPSS